MIRKQPASCPRDASSAASASGRYPLPQPTQRQSLSGEHSRHGGKTRVHLLRLGTFGKGGQHLADGHAG